MRFENTEVFNFDGALRGMRNPLNSWDKGDSFVWQETGEFTIGANDMKLAQNLVKAGSDHSKFMRQIMVSVDVTAGLYWWKEYDTYKVGTVANSTSTMHKLATTPITKECFEFDAFEDDDHILDMGDHPYTWNDSIEIEIEELEMLRKKFIDTKDKRYWRALIQRLPSAWFQTRTCTLSYQNIRAMYFARRNHKLTEWSVDFVNWVRTLPYAEELIMLETEESGSH